MREAYFYFDSAAAAPPPDMVVKAVKDYLDKTAFIGPYVPSFRKETYAKIEATRASVAAFIGGKPSEIAFTKNGSEAISIIARSITWQAGDEIIIPDTEMMSNVAIWQILATEYGLKIVRVKANKEGIIEPEAILEAFTSKTKLLTFVALSNATGALQPIAKLCKLAKEHNVLTHVSASQALGLLNIDCGQLQCDFLSACGRKSLRAIEGTGILFVKEKLIKALRPVLAGWWNASFDKNGQLVFPSTARRFEDGCPIVPAIISLDAAIEYANRLGINNIEAKCRALTQYAVEKLQSIKNHEIYGPSDSNLRLGIIPFNIKGVNPYELTNWLESRYIIIEAGSFMAGAILKNYNIEAMARISVHYFNDYAQIDKLIALINEFISENR